MGGTEDVGGDVRETPITFDELIARMVEYEVALQREQHQLQPPPVTVAHTHGLRPQTCVEINLGMVNCTIKQSTTTIGVVLDNKPTPLRCVKSVINKVTSQGIVMIVSNNWDSTVVLQIPLPHLTQHLTRAGSWTWGCRTMLPLNLETSPSI